MVAFDWRRTILYLTHWSAYGTFLAYLFFVIGYLHPPLIKKTWFWKTNHLLFEFAFTVGSVVSLVFWAVIGPMLLTMSREQISSLAGKSIHVEDYILNAEIHGVSYLFVFIDFYYNRIEFCWPHLALHILVGIIYFAQMMAYVIISHDLVYPMVNFENWFSLAFAIVPFLIGAAAFSVGVCLTRKKKLRYETKDVRSESIDQNVLSINPDPELPRPLMQAQF